MSSSDIFFGEILGTTVLILLGGGVVAGVVLKRSKAFGAGWVAITFGWGLAVLSGTYVSVQLSGAHLNPAVTLGIAIDSGEWGDVPTYVAGQMLGAMLGAMLVWLAYYGHFQAHLTGREIVGGSETPGPAASRSPHSPRSVRWRDPASPVRCSASSRRPPRSATSRRT